ncbi:uncharacterized protein LOC143291316 [Babylonia areolata]|uniref:uncharacterized protein LOC143291316 n=1 Tax=Babylonia areolata TaxID=304850 RepID=UPI003FD0642B
MLGSLSALSALEAEATHQQKREAQVKAHRNDHQFQLQKIEQLKQRRNELLQMLHDKADSETSSRNDKRNSEESASESDELTSALAYVTELKEKLQVYKMTGVCVVKTDATNKVLCFSTSHGHVYLESYHLHLHRLASGSFKIIHHDLPPFILHCALPPNLEVKDMLTAVRPVQEALAMFVLRREQLKEAEGKFPDTLHVMESSAAVDYLHCLLDIGEDVQVEITLKYSDLNHYLPSTVKAVLLKPGGRGERESIPQDMADSVQSALCSHSLCVALSHTAQLLQGLLHTHTHSSSETP